MRLDQIANPVDTYIIGIVIDVAASAQATVFLPLFLEGKKSFFHIAGWYEPGYRTNPQAGVGSDRLSAA